MLMLWDHIRNRLSLLGSQYYSLPAYQNSSHASFDVARYSCLSFLKLSSTIAEILSYSRRMLKFFAALLEAHCNILPFFASALQHRASSLQTPLHHHRASSVCSIALHHLPIAISGLNADYDHSVAPSLNSEVDGNSEESAEMRGS